MLSPILEELTKNLETWVLCIALEKLQKMPPFQYLGQVIDGRLIDPSWKGRDQERKLKNFK
jgi:hypothetical protein